jgi:tetratricopeptide (TPR) repeat protein
MAIAIDDLIVSFLFNKAAEKGILKLKTKEDFNRHLTGLIDQVYLEYEKNHPHKSSKGQYQFFGSAKFINQLFEFRFYNKKKLDFQKIKIKLQKDPQILPFSGADFDEYISLFESKVANDNELRNYEVDKNYKTEIFKISKQLDRVEKKLDNVLADKNKTVNNIRKINLPPPPEKLIGRLAKLDEIHNLLMSENEILLVNGLGGIGKTTIAQAYINSKHFTGNYDILAWIKVLNNFKTDFITTFSTVLKIDLSQISNENQFEFVHSHLCNLPGKKLLIIDNVNDLQDLNNNLYYIKSLGWKVIITSRTNPEDMASINVDELSPEDARQLFLEHYKAEHGEVDLGELDRLLELIYYHTLFIELLAKACRKRKFTIALAIEKIMQSGFSNPELQRKIKHGHHADLTDREKESAIKDYMISLFEPENIKRELQHILIYFSVFPPEDIPLELLKVLFNVGQDKAIAFEDNLDDLYQMGWLAGDGSSYKMHGLVQEIIIKKLEPDAKKCEALAEGLSYYFQHLNISSTETLLPFAEQLLTNIHSYSSSTVFLAGYLSENYQKIGNIDMALYWAVFVSREFTKTDDRENLAISYSKLGEIYQALGDFDKSLEFYNKEVNLFEELYQSNPKSESLKNGLAISYEKLGSIYQALGDFDKSLEFYNKQVNLFEELYQSNPKSESLKNGLAISFGILGDLYIAKNDIEKAYEFGVKANNLFIELLNANNKNIETQNNLALSEMKLGQLLYMLKPQEEQQNIIKHLQIAMALWDDLHAKTGIEKFKKQADQIRKMFSPGS